MKDKDFLQFIHNRLHEYYGENENCDYMHKLRAIIKATDESQETPNVASFNQPTGIEK